MRTLTGIRLRLRLRRFAPNAHRAVNDGAYAVLDPEAPARLHHEWSAAAWARDMTEWIPERVDCDEWAWLFRGWCLHRHIISTGRQAGLAVGYIHYRRAADGLLHSANFAVVADCDDTRFAPIEPQPGEGPINLTDQERESISLVVI